MTTGILICVLGALSFGMLAVVSKVAERKRCSSAPLVTWAFAWAALFMFAETAVEHEKAPMTWSVAGLAIVLGICAAVAYFAFQISISRGKVTVGWLMMNLSAGVPAVVSIWIYGENFSTTKAIAFVLAFISVICLFQGNRLEAQASAERKAR